MLCRHGNPNVLTADVPSSRLSQGCTGQHALVQIERCPVPPPPVTVKRAAEHPPRKPGTQSGAGSGARTVTTIHHVLPVPALDRLPEITSTLAARAAEHDRDATFPFEGIATVHAAGSDAVFATGSASIIDNLAFYDLVARGGIDLTFLGGAQIDRHGRVNSSLLGTQLSPRVRFPGGGGAAFILPAGQTRHHLAGQPRSTDLYQEL